MDLIIFTAQGSPYQWAGIGWVEVEGDWTYVYQGAIFETLGATLSALADGPAATTKLYPKTKKERWPTLLVQRSIFANEKGWAKLMPRPNPEDCK